MGEIAKSVGQRIRNYRTQRGLSQEKLAELSGCHPTYVGQLERGEKTQPLRALNGSQLRWIYLSQNFLRSWAVRIMRKQTFP